MSRSATRWLAKREMDVFVWFERFRRKGGRNPHKGEVMIARVDVCRNQQLSRESVSSPARVFPVFRPQVPPSPFFFLLPSFRLLQKDSSLRKRWLCDKSQSPNWICDDRTDSNGIGVSPRAVLCNHTPPVSLCRICLLCWYVVSCSCVVCEGKNLLSGLDDGRTRLNG